MTEEYKRRCDYHAAWRYANRDKKKAWRDANKERQKINTIAWRLKNSENHRAQRAKYRSANVEKLKAYRDSHREQSRQTNQKQRAKKNRVAIVNPEVIKLWEKRWRTKLFVICYWCQKPIRAAIAHADHIFPVSKGGIHSIDNLCISCARCNHKKYARPLTEWNGMIKEPILL